MRTGEVFALTWDDIDLENRTIKITKTVYAKDKNKKEFGKKYKYYFLKEIKNKYGKVIEYVIVESKTKKDRLDMVFTKRNGLYSGTDVIKYPLK